MGLLRDVLPDWLPEDPNKADAVRAGLLNFGAAMLQGRGNFGQALGDGLAAGAQGYQGAREDQYQNTYRQAQAGQLNAKAEQEKRRNDTISRIGAGYESNPNYKPSMADLLMIDPDGAVKGMMPGGGVDFGLEPKIGINPATQKPSYFIQDKRGGTKWLDAQVPPSLQFVPGSDYLPPQVFDKHDGSVRPIGPRAGVQQQPGPSGSAYLPTMAGTNVPEQPEADPNAPWNRVVAPKERDQMRTRVYESDRKRLDDLKERVSSGKTVMRDLDRFGELNRTQGTGGLIDRIGSLPTFDAEKREMESIQARLAPNMRPAGSGTTSDRDIALYLQGLPGVDKPGDVNKNIREQFAKQLADAEQQLAFREQYLVDYGHLNGADDAHALAKERGKSGGLDLSQLTPEQIEYLRQTDSEAVDRGVARFQKNGGKSYKEHGYASPAAAIQEAQSVILRNPKAKAEVIRRLEASGITNHGIR